MNVTSDPQNLGKLYDTFTSIGVFYDGDHNVNKIRLVNNNNDIYDILIDTDKLCCEIFSNKIIGNINIDNLDYITISFTLDDDKEYNYNYTSNNFFLSLEKLYINFHMKDNTICYLRNICITNGYYRHYIKLLKNNNLLFKSFI